MKCYHIWKMAETGNAMFRWKKCYHNRQTANSTVRNWLTQGPDRNGHRPSNIWVGDDAKAQFQVLECRPLCPCDCRRTSVN